jgi:hypothetical protein
MRTTTTRMVNAAYDPTSDRYSGFFTPEDLGVVVRIHTPICVRGGKDYPAVVAVALQDRWWALNVASSVDVSPQEVDDPVPFAGTWTLSMARPAEWPAVPAPGYDEVEGVGIKVTFEVETP